MTTVRFSILLDDDWVDAILTTAFDTAVGGCNYWINEGDVEEYGDVKEVLFDDDGTEAKRLEMVTLLFDKGIAQFRNQHLADAIERIMNHPQLMRTETARQIRDACSTPNDLPDLDAEACDVIIQVAMFGEILYG